MFYNYNKDIKINKQLFLKILQFLEKKLFAVISKVRVNIYLSITTMSEIIMSIV